MDLPTRLRVIQLYYANSSSPIATLRAYKREKNLRNDPFSVQSVINLVAKFEKTYALHDKPRTGRPSLMEERGETVQDAVEELQAANPHGHASSAHIAAATDIPERSVRRILREHLGLFPYHLSTSQAVTETDKKARLDFVKWLSDNDDLIDSILWSDEAYFTLDGCVNKHNCVIWGLEKPQWTLPRHLHSPKVCVWMGFSSSCKLQPFFFPATVTDENYLDLRISEITSFPS